LSEYHNPQQDPGSQKRLMLAFLLVFVMIAAMQFFLPKAKPPQQEKPGATPQPTTQTTPVAAPTATPKPTAPRHTPKAATKQAATESDTVLENDFYRVTLSNRGAVAKTAGRWTWSMRLPHQCLGIRFRSSPTIRHWKINSTTVFI
jgi:YidC/Oxa1 family membrane protein insertase